MTLNEADCDSALMFRACGLFKFNLISFKINGFVVSDQTLFTVSATILVHSRSRPQLSIFITAHSKNRH